MDLNWKVEELTVPLRLDRYLAQKLSSEGHSRNVVVKMIHQGWVSVNGQATKESDTPLKGGESVAVSIPSKKPSTKEETALEILYEDSELVAINKPSGLITHPVSSLAFKLNAEWSDELGVRDNPSVLDWIIKKYPQSKKVSRYGIVHRLDEGTSGILLIAKTEKAYARLTKMFQQREINKTYLALVWGTPEPKNGVVNLKISKNYGPRGVKLEAEEDEGQEAETYYKTLKVFKEASLLEFKPSTGRTHQLRLHAGSLGTPVCGDPAHGRKQPRDPFERLMLHAWKIEFKMGPKSKKISLKCPLAKDFKAQALRLLHAKISY